MFSSLRSTENTPEKMPARHHQVLSPVFTMAESNIVLYPIVSYRYWRYTLEASL